MDYRLLCRRILGTMTTSALVACGGQTGPTGTGSSSGSSTAGSPTGEPPRTEPTTSPTSAPTASVPAVCESGGRKERECLPPDNIITKNSNYGGRPLPPDAAPPPPPTRDANGCVVLEEVMSGCCNPAIEGPTFESGQCCYAFCAGSCCGRPLVFEGTPRVAHAALRSDWSATTVRSVLDDATRIALRDSWTKDALYEHASIASFAALLLELLAVGAPPQLLHATQQAVADEIEHAGLTFSIAGKFSEHPIGPGSLDVAGLTPRTDLVSIAAACVRDGCLNETIAAAIASAQASRTNDPEIRSALERIAEDETRHAELAWRIVAWALSTKRADVRSAVVAAFETPMNFAPEHPAGVDPASWHAHGRLLPAEHHEVVRSVIAEVIGPCKRRLLDGAMPPLAAAAS